MTDQAVPGHKYRLAILARHVVQYHSPLYREIAESETIAPTVLFMDKTGLEPVFDETINAAIEWDIPLLDGFDRVFMRNWSPFRRQPFLDRINPGVVAALRRKRCDGVLIQGYNTATCWLALCAAKLAGVQVLFRGEAILRPERSSRHKEALKSFVVRAFLKHSDAVLYACGKNREFFEHYGCPPGKLYPFPCAVDNTHFRAQREALRASGNNLRSELGIPEGIPTGLIVARMTSRKRQADLVRAAAKVQAKGHAIALVLLGDGPERTALEALAAKLKLEHAYFVGFQNQSRVPAYYDMADFCCLCSEYDPTPKTISEALNFELPVVSSDRVGTVGDSIVDGDNAFVYNCGDIEALADCLERIVRDPETRHRMGKRSIELSDRLNFAADVAGLESAVEALKAKGR